MKTYREPGYQYAVSTEVTERLGKGMKVLQELQNVWVRVWCSIELTEPVGYG